MIDWNSPDVFLNRLQVQAHFPIPCFVCGVQWAQFYPHRVLNQNSNGKEQAGVRADVQQVGKTFLSLIFLSLKYKQKSYFVHSMR